jgi:FkbM family methyltransferase
MNKSQINDIQFWHRPNTSDLKTFEEVIGKDVYRKKGMTIQPGEEWYDCGGNIGAFTLLACSLGANVVVFEPDPNNCQMIKKNLTLNGFKAEIVCAALVHDDTQKANLYVGNNGNVWRNSLYKNWNGKGLKVDCINFDQAVKSGSCVKMDIEGGEMSILENTNHIFKKLVFEWSFDIDPSLPRFWNIIEKLQQNYKIADIGNTGKFITRDYESWNLRYWFPACANIFCYEKN